MIETDEDIQKGTQVLIDYGANFGFRMDAPSSYTKIDAENFCKTVTPAIFKLDYTDFDESEKEEEDEEEAKLVRSTRKRQKNKKDKKEGKEKLNQEGGDKEEEKEKQQRPAVRKSARRNTTQATYVEEEESSDSAEVSEGEGEGEKEGEEGEVEKNRGGKKKAKKRQREEKTNTEDKDDKEQKKKDEDSKAPAEATAGEAPAKKKPKKKIPKKIEVLVKFRDGDITLKDVEPGHLIKAMVQTAVTKATAKSITVPKNRVLTAGAAPFNNNSILLSACELTVEEVLMVPESDYFVGDKALEERKFLVHIFGLTEFKDMQKSSAPKTTARAGRGKPRGAKLPR